MMQYWPPPPDPVRRILRHLLPGTRGEEILHELDREYGALHESRSGATAWAWYLAQLLRPATWQLAWALRRTRDVKRDPAPERLRHVRGTGWFAGLSLDLKLAGRMLRKSPGLSVVGVLGIALGTGVGVAFFLVASQLVDPEVPLPEGDRIVALVNRDVERNRDAPRSLHHFLTWRDEMRSVEAIAAASRAGLPLGGERAAAHIVRSAAMTASAFEVTRVPPLLGRYVDPEDERPGAPRVAVLGYNLWQTRFDGDPAVLGRTVVLGGGQVHTVVGVMPPGFAFPRNEELWTALRASRLGFDRGAGPPLVVFGRLAPGVTPERAQAELDALGRRAAAAFPETDAHLRPRIFPYPQAFGARDVTAWEVAQVQFMVLLILMAIAANMAVLVYARTVLRQGEIAMRTALGASRRRIVAQLFLEALLLSLFGAGLGLALAQVTVQRVHLFVEGLWGIPFWVDYSFDPRSSAYAVVLAVLAAVVIGVVPGLKATGRRLDRHLRRMGAGASEGLGWMWTALIIAQVTVVLAVLPSALHLGASIVTPMTVGPTFRAREFLSADLLPPPRPGMDLERNRQGSAAHLADVLPELERRLEAEPVVVGVSYSSSERAMEGRGGRVEIEGAPTGSSAERNQAPATGVTPDYFDLVGASLVAGRLLRASDAGEPGGGVVVSEAFVRRVLNGGTAVGRRIRFLGQPERGEPSAEVQPGPWLEIVGVVEDLEASAIDPTQAPPKVYYPVSPEWLRPPTLLVRVRDGRGEPEDFAPRLRQIVSSLDPDLHLASVENLANRESAPLLRTIVSVIVAGLGAVLLLSAAGIHALTSIAVTRRRREIGIRRALGSSAGRLLANLFSRAGWQLGFGMMAGSLVGGALLLDRAGTGWEMGIFVGGVVVLLSVAGFVAALGPALRGLRIQPSEALKEE